METIVVSARKYFNQIHNGNNFSANGSNYATHLLGSVGERVKCVIDFSVAWSARAVDGVVFTTANLGGGVFSVTRNYGSFLDDGLKIGDTTDFYSYDHALMICTGGTITYISDTVIYITGTYSYANYGFFYDAEIHGTTALTAGKYYYGIVGNNDSATFSSAIEGSDQGFYGQGFDSGPVTLDELGNIVSWQFGDIVTIDRTGTSGYTQLFTLTHEFVILPFYLDGQEADMEAGIAPSYLSGANSLKHVFKVELSSAISNPNTIHTFTDSQTLGEVSWFNERFNGLQNLEYSYTAPIYQEVTSGDSCDGLLVGGNTLVELELYSETGAFSSGDTAFVLGLFRLSTESQYEPSASNEGDANFIYETLRQVVDDSPVTGTIINNLSIVLNSASAVTLSAEIDLSGVTVTENEKYGLFVICQEFSTSTPISDHVALLVDVKNFDKFADTSGLLTFEQVRLWHHYQDSSVGSGRTNFKGWVEDGFLAYAQAVVKYSPYPDAAINFVRGKIIAINTADETEFELDAFNFDLSQVVTVGGVQQINVTQPRQYKLASGDQFLDARIEMGSGTLTAHVYDIYIPFKMRYEDWIANVNAATEFFNSAKPKNNLNYKASNYSNGQEDFNIVVVFEVGMDNGDGEITTYRAVMPDFEVYDYEEDGNTPAHWTAEIQTFTSGGGTNLGGAILETANTLVKAVFTHYTAAINVNNAWGVIRIEELNGGQNAIRELSSIWSAPSNNILVPESGETATKITSGTNTVTLSCEIDFTQLDPTKTYVLSARFGGLEKLAAATESIKGRMGSSDVIFITGDGKVIVKEP